MLEGLSTEQIHLRFKNIQNFIKKQLDKVDYFYSIIPEGNQKANRLKHQYSLWIESLFPEGFKWDDNPDEEWSKDDLIYHCRSMEFLSRETVKLQDNIYYIVKNYKALCKQCDKEVSTIQKIGGFICGICRTVLR